jgi:hypothetical protein
VKDELVLLTKDGSERRLHDVRAQGALFRGRMGIDVDLASITDAESADASAVDPDVLADDVTLELGSGYVERRGFDSTTPDDDIVCSILGRLDERRERKERSYARAVGDVRVRAIRVRRWCSHGRVLTGRWALRL